MFQSYAQNGEDIVLWRVLKTVENGMYVDVGAADPDEDSVTKAFYERGWSGVNIEPAPDYAARLASERQRDILVQACAGDSDGSIVLHHVVGTGLSSVVADSIDQLSETSYDVVDVEVPVRRLDDLLRTAGLGPDQPIHFLKIDVEGFEESVIRGIDLTVWRPWIIVAESTKPRSIEQVHDVWEPLLLESGYEFCLFDGLNRFYLASEHAEMRDLLSFPACVFDHPFLTPLHPALMLQFDLLSDRHEQLQAIHDGAMDSYNRLEADLLDCQAGYARLEATYDEAMESYRQLQATYDDAIEAFGRLEAELLHCGAGYARLETELTALTEQHAALAEETATLRAGVAQMGAEFDRLREERDAARQELELTRETLSWRVTQPLRAARSLRAR